MNYDHLRASATHTPKPAIQGTWQAIQFQPDFTTDERFNIGVVFFENRKTTPHARLLPSLAGFSALYGNTGAENFKFLLSLLKEQLIDKYKAISPGPQIIFSQKKFAAGNNPQEIVDRLFNGVVTLALAKNDEDEISHSLALSTEDLRKLIIKIAHQKMGKGWPSIFPQAPIFMQDKNGGKHSLDLPIWRGDDLINTQLYGTILSAQFRSSPHRAASLYAGYANFNQANQLAPKAKGALLILRPPSNSPGYDNEVLNAIDNDIDKITWPYLKRQELTICVSEKIEDLTEAALALAQ